jgi:hypothetical protein
MTIKKLKENVWWEYIHDDKKELLTEAVLLLKTAKKWREDKDSLNDRFHDYSFIVFPAAKAYEGFLKRLFLDMKFITEKDYYGKRFRVGKVLNPSLDRTKYKKISVYDKIAKFCGGQDLAKNLWATWKKARNLLFHWFPKEKNAVTLPEAEARLNMVIESMNRAFKECKI